jgi:hypothetical protein
MKIGWVACDYTEGDTLDEVRHGEIRSTYDEAAADRGYQGIRYVHTDGYLYVDEGAAPRYTRRRSIHGRW